MPSEAIASNGGAHGSLFARRPNQGLGVVDSAEQKFNVASREALKCCHRLSVVGVRAIEGGDDDVEDSEGGRQVGGGTVDDDAVATSMSFR